MDKNYIISIITPLILIFMIACNGGEMAKEIEQYNSIEDIPNSNWDKLAQKKIYFGHQSVGANIIEGINSLMEENSKITLNIVKTKNPEDFHIGLFAHSAVGKNGYPETKIDDYAKVITNGIGEKADFSFFKLCYVDVRTETDIKKVFSVYKDVVGKLTKKYSDTTFIHVTVPLTTELTKIELMSKKIKKFIMRLLGKPYWWPPHGNINRNLFNELIINEYSGNSIIFDLAAIESTFPDGSRCTFNKNNKTYYSLVPEYTNDGGHLNGTGSRLVAEKLLLLLANL